MSRTTREIKWRLEAMSIRQHTEFKLQASLHGIDLQDTIEPVESEITPEMAQALDRAKAESLARIKNRGR